MSPPDIGDQTPSHLKTHLQEVFAAMRLEAMSFLVVELMAAFHEHGYQLDEFLDCLADYLADRQPNCDRAIAHLESASRELAIFRRSNSQS